jgi:acetyl/propionyl-CoA carboxylase alpha subunit
MRFVIVRDEKHIPVELEERDGGYLVTLDGRPYEVESARILEGLYSLLIEGESYEVTVHPSSPGLYDVHLYDGMRPVELLSPLEMVLRSQHGKSAGQAFGVKAPMPGKVVKVLVSEGQRVAKGQGVVVVEAMKMQNELQALSDGVVRQIRVKEGDTVESGAELVTLGEDLEDS